VTHNLSSIQQNSVIHGVKRRGEVEQDENGSVIAVDGIEKI